MLRALTSVTALVGFLLAPSALAAPYFVDKTPKLGSQACAGGGCYTNYVALADLDGDHDLDIVFPNANGYFVKAASEPLVVLRNDGNLVFADDSAKLGGGKTGWIRQVAIGDIDGDGDLDIFAPDAWGAADALYVNDGKGTFSNEAATRTGGSHSRAGSTRFGDVDADGDLDLIIGDWGTAPPKGAWSAHLFLNDGKGNFTAADRRLPTPVKPNGTGPVDVDLLDIDGDFDLDVLFDGHNGSMQLWTNDGLGSFVDASMTFPDQPSGLHYGPAVCDVDGDGDLDVWVDNGTANSDEQLLINDGSGKLADQTATRVVGNTSGDDDNGVACIDVDGDGDFDAAIASLSGNERILINDGRGHFLLAADAFPAVVDSTLGFDFGDLDGDGKLDAVTAQGESGSFLDRLYSASASAPADTRPPTLRRVESIGPSGVGKAPTLRFAVSDNAVTDTGPRLAAAEVEITFGSAPPETVPARFMGGDLFLATLPARTTAGTVKWRVCATDRANNRGCSPLATYEIMGPAGGEGSPGDDADSGAGPLRDAGTMQAGADAGGDAGKSSPTAGPSGAGADPGTTSSPSSSCAVTIGGSSSEVPLVMLSILAALRARRRQRAAAETPREAHTRRRAIHGRKSAPWSAAAHFQQSKLGQKTSSPRRT